MSQSHAPQYRYKVFISYSMGSNAADIAEHLMHKPLATLLVDQGCGHDSVYFYPRNTNGGPLPAEVAWALTNSAILMPLWTDAYWLSDWCVCEYQTFLKRDRLLAAREPTAQVKEHPARPTSRVLPLLFNPGGHRPDLAGDLLPRHDMSSFRTFRNRRKSVKEAWEAKLIEISDQLGHQIRAIPHDEPCDWPVAPMPRLHHVGPNPSRIS